MEDIKITFDNNGKLYKLNKCKPNRLNKFLLIKFNEYGSNLVWKYDYPPRCIRKIKGDIITKYPENIREAYMVNHPEKMINLVHLETNNPILNFTLFKYLRNLSVREIRTSELKGMNFDTLKLYDCIIDTVPNARCLNIFAGCKIKCNLISNIIEFLIVDRQIKFYGNMPNLRYLDGNMINLNNNGWKIEYLKTVFHKNIDLKHMNMLRCLEVYGNQIMNNSYLDGKNLEYLKIIGETSIYKINMEELYELDISGNMEITAPKLKVLSLSNYNMSLDINNFPQINSLTIRNSNINLKNNKISLDYLCVENCYFNDNVCDVNINKMILDNCCGINIRGKIKEIDYLN